MTQLSGISRRSSLTNNNQLVMHTMRLATTASCSSASVVQTWKLGIVFQTALHSSMYISNALQDW